MNAVALLINIIIYLVVVGALVGLVNYVVDHVPIADPLGRLIKIAAVVIGVLVIVIVLLNLVGVGGMTVPVIR
jgi:hypothetical protein